jgi:hypothetical protein
VFAFDLHHCHILITPSISINKMQGPTAEEAEASVSTEHVREGPDTVTSLNAANGTVAVRRKVAKRTLPWDLAAEELDLVSPQSPQAEVIPATKKSRLEESFSGSTDEAAKKLSSHDTAVSRPPAAPAADNTNANRVEGIRRTRWTPEEDAKLIGAVKSNSTKYMSVTDWAAVAVLVPNRTRKQCWNRWHNSLDPNIERANGRTGKWTEDEDIKLKDSVKIHSGKDWAAITVLVPDRTQKQCHYRWSSALDPSIDRVNVRMGKWTEDEDSKLKDAVQTHGGKDWVAISALVPSRVAQQCRHRWHTALDPNRVNGRTGKWANDEDSQLRHAVQTLWAEDEGSKLRYAVQTHGGKNWAAIAALVPGRAEKHCLDRWRNILDPSIDRAKGRKGRWAEDEDSKLRDAVRTQGDKNWVAISSLSGSNEKIVPAQMARCLEFLRIQLET